MVDPPNKEAGKSAEKEYLLSTHHDEKAKNISARKAVNYMADLERPATADVVNARKQLNALDPYQKNLDLSNALPVGGY